MYSTNDETIYVPARSGGTFWKYKQLVQNGNLDFERCSCSTPLWARLSSSKTDKTCRREREEEGVREEEGGEGGREREEEGVREGEGGEGGREEREG